MAVSSKRSSLVPSPSRLIPQLPDEISIMCIARVPRLLQPTLALVSRSWRSLLNSPILFSVRSELGISRPFICFTVLLLPSEQEQSQSQWYLLDPDPENPRPLLRLPPPPIPTVGYAYASLGPTIFVIGGHLNRIPSSAVQIFDARLNRWSVGPSMAVTRGFTFVEAIGGRIYAKNEILPPPNSWGEVLDPGLGVWTPVPSPTYVQEKRLHYAGSVKLYTLGSPEGEVVSDPEAAKAAWSVILPRKHLLLPENEVVVDGVLFTFNSIGEIKAYDHRANKWMPLEGLRRKPATLSGLANVGGILCAIWVSLSWYWGSPNMMVLEFAGIKVSRKRYGGLRGSLVWTKSVILAEKESFKGPMVELEL